MRISDWSSDVCSSDLLALDVTDPASVRAAAQAASDVTLLVNNAGISTGTDLVTGSLDNVRRELDTNVLGGLVMIRELAPALAAIGRASCRERVCQYV